MGENHTLKLTPRPYQKEAIELAEKDFFSHKLKSGMICHPTGGGKTFAAAKFVADALTSKKITKCLWLVHSIELCNEAYNTFKNLGLNTSKWNRDTKEVSDITICMIQSAKNLSKECKSFDLIVIDEAHHFAVDEKNENLVTTYENRYSKLLKQLKHKHLLGLTATPTRLDGKRLSFEKVIHLITFYDLVKLGFLAKPQYHEIKTEQYYQLSKNSRSDFTQKSLGSLNNSERNEKIASEWYKNKNKFGKTIVFCVSIDHCNSLMSEFIKLDKDIKCKTVTGKTDKTLRSTIVDEFDKGLIDIVFNCQVFTEGFNSPSINTVLIARPTMSETLFMQMIGRGSRILPNKNEYNIVVIVDDIQRFATIVKVWKPLLLGKSKEDIQQEQFEAELKAAEEEYERVIHENRIDLPLGDISAIDVEAVLQISSLFITDLGFIIDRDRHDCLRKLYKYGNHLIDQGILSSVSIVESYTICVPSREFTQKDWERITWAWHFKYMRGRDRINDHETWKRISLTELTTAKKKEISKRINSSFAISRKKNEEYNEKYGNGKEVFRLLIEEIKKQNKEKKLSYIKIVLSNIDYITSKNRNLIIQTSLSNKVTEYQRQIRLANMYFNPIMEDFLEDPSCQVKFKMTR